MAKKASAAKGRKTAGKKRTAPQKQRPVSNASVSLSVTDGAMKSVIRSAFLRRDR
ncbi:MAG: hypothetical protein OEU46_13175 [Alphaproteobacteria bacterium]|nr:hypothetical protein [Alphaproteobacteria bacterium]